MDHWMLLIRRNAYFSSGCWVVIWLKFMLLQWMESCIVQDQWSTHKTLKGHIIGMDAVLIYLSCICNHSSHVYHIWGALAENIISQLFCLFSLGGSLCILGTAYTIFF